MRHRGHGEETEGPAQGATDSAKPYTTEQLDAVRKSVHVQIFVHNFVLIVETHGTQLSQMAFSIKAENTSFVCEQLNLM